jgi:glycosyltransferase involved in cell wall biosynthesis
LDSDFRLSIVGAGPAAAKIQSRVAAHGLQQCIHLEGTVPSAHMPQWLRSCDVVVLPSISRPNWIEQFGRILVEAMACGLPVVGSTCGEIPGVIGDAGLVFQEGDSAALAASLRDLAANPSLRADLAARGRRRVLERFTHEHIAAATVGVYRSMLTARGSDRAENA